LATKSSWIVKSSAESSINFSSYGLTVTAKNPFNLEFTIMTKKTIYRRSDNGQLTTKDYAEKHPKTAEKERVNVANKNNNK
jgi:hypothetical protein